MPPVHGLLSEWVVLSQGPALFQPSRPSSLSVARRRVTLFNKINDLQKIP